MLKNLALLILWFAVAPPLLVFTILLASKQNRSFNILGSHPSVITTQAENENNIEGQVLATKIQDLRPYIVSRFLKNTPLEKHSQYIVEISDKYGIDYRLIPAIAMKESGAGNNIDITTYNAWGWENGRTNFNSWESAIDSVAKTLKNSYISKGLTTPEQIMAVYAPPQLSTGGKWAKDINFFFSQMETL